jgi:RNA polymerase sigma factor (sigma-70 family)
MQHQMVTTPARPSRAQIEPAALELLARHSAGLLATARRYSATPQDAEDAYQRGVEILLTKAPSTTEDELLPWLKTVVKHEAFAVRKSGARAVLSDQPIVYEQDEHAWTDERAERYERLRMGAEAMAALKPQEIRCLLLKAEGLSYREICDVTGFSYTKVNRCITEGRRAFLSRVAGIEAGAECERLAPLISKVADGEATPDEMRLVRPHLKSCLACKATLREYRETPARLAGLVPPVAVLAGGSGSGAGLMTRLLERFGGIGDAAGAKVAAVAASAVVLAGGGAVAGVDPLHHDPPAVAPSAFADSAARDAAAASSDPSAAAAAPTASAPDPSAAAIQAVADPHPARSGADPQPLADPKPSDPIAEFDPGMGASGGSSPASAPAASTPAASWPTASAPSTSSPTASSPAAPAPASARGGGSRSGTGEFGP